MAGGRGRHGEEDSDATAFRGALAVKVAGSTCPVSGGQGHASRTPRSTVDPALRPRHQQRVALLHDLQQAGGRGALAVGRAHVLPLLAYENLRMEKIHRTSHAAVQSVRRTAWSSRITRNRSEQQNRNGGGAASSRSRSRCSGIIQSGRSIAAMGGRSIAAEGAAFNRCCCSSRTYSNNRGSTAVDASGACCSAAAMAAAC